MAGNITAYVDTLHVSHLINIAVQVGIGSAIFADLHTALGAQSIANISGTEEAADADSAGNSSVGWSGASAPTDSIPDGYPLICIYLFIHCTC